MSIRIILESKDHKGVVRLDFEGKNKTWLMTAYAKSSRELQDTIRSLQSFDAAQQSPHPPTENSLPQDQTGGNVNQGTQQGEYGGGEAFARTDKAIESEFQARVDHNFDKLVQDYQSLGDSEGGLVLNTDIARELSPDYLADRISEAVFKGFAADYVHKSGLSRGLSREGSSDQFEQARSGSERAASAGQDAAPRQQINSEIPAKSEIPPLIVSKGDDPALRQVEQALADRPDLSVPVADGEVVPAIQALDHADADLAKAEADAPGFEAAVTCFLRD